MNLLASTMLIVVPGNMFTVLTMLALVAPEYMAMLAMAVFAVLLATVNPITVACMPVAVGLYTVVLPVIFEAR